MGLGPLADVSLAEAREKARRLRNDLREGKNPLAERQRASKRQEASFRECAEEFMADKGQHWTTKHRSQWTNTLKTYAYPKIGAHLVSTITVDEVHGLLRGIWASKTETASRVRGRIESVLDWATVKGFREGPNPARWKGNLEHLLDRKEEVQPKQHLEALDYKELPDFYAKLVELEEVGPLALRLCILTGVRADAINRAEWTEFDLEEGIWTVPADRTKTLRFPFRVPLSDEALTVLEAVPRAAGVSWVFMGHKHGTHISNSAMRMLLRKRMNLPTLTVHGFRSTFRDWIADETSYPNHVAEMVLGHTIGDKTEAAYRRKDLFKKRQQLMADWSRYCSSPHDGVVELRKVR